MIYRSSQMISNNIGSLLFLIASISFVVVSESCFHWFLLPVTLCGITLAKDAQDWAVGKLDLFDTKGFIAILGIHLFYLAPLLHVYWNIWIQTPAPPPDWRNWIGYMGTLNLIGLIIYNFIVNKKPKRSIPSLKTKWKINTTRFFTTCSLALLFTLSVQLYVYYRFGGLPGYISAFESRDDSFRDMGWVFMISESFPIIAFMAYAILASKFFFLRKWVIIVLVLVFFLTFQMLFGGLRGSRSNIIWGLFWASGILHYWVRPLKPQIIIIGIVAIISFMYVYGFFKHYGSDAFQVLSNPRLHKELSYDSGRTLQNTILGDLARSDIQALLLYRLTDSEKTYNYKWGLTYLQSLTLIFPRSIRPELIGKREAGTEAQHGFFSENFLSSNVYGITGEAMLNWGVLSVPFAFAIFGFLVSKIRQFIISLPKFDLRNMISPFLINLSFVALIGDSDNVIIFIIMNGAIPILFLWFAKRVVNVLPLPFCCFRKDNPTPTCRI